MARPADTARVAFLAPLVHGAFGALARVITGMSVARIRASLERMESDPTEVLIWENAGARAWTAYDAGGPLGADRVELTLAPSLTDMMVEQLVDMLQTFAAADSVRLAATLEPWRILARAARQPRAVVEMVPTLGAPEDLVIRIVLGAKESADRLFKPGFLEALWKRRTAEALQSWIAANQARPLHDHPAYAEVVEPPARGLPGVYLVRTPPIPYTPLFPASVYQNPVCWAVFETSEELAACRAYYGQPGASFFTEPPLFRNRPPCSAQPARLVGGITAGRARVVRAPWDGAVSVLTLPDAALQQRPRLRQEAYRGRYLVNGADDVDQALALWRKAGLTVQEVDMR